MRPLCKVPDCERDRSTRGYCQMHYRRVLKTGRPGPPSPLRSRGSCKVEDCDKEVDARDLCHGHYQRVQRRSSLPIETPLRQGKSECSVEDCDRDAELRGYCRAHYKRVLKHGNPQAEIPIRQAQGKGTISQDGYRYVPVPKELRHLTGNSTWIGEHRLVMARRLGRALTSDEQVHHINGDRTDNSLGNLELWSTSHPSGQRVEDLLVYCMTMLERYGEQFGVIGWE